MGLFRRSKPLHERLAEEGALDIRGASDDTQADVLALDPPKSFGGLTPLGGAGLHGVPRQREWDVVTRAEAELSGEEVRFVALPDGTLLVDEDVPDGAFAPLADAIELSLEPPYRAEGVRRGQSTWAVAAKRIDVRELPGHEGEELELIEGDEVLLGRRLDGDLWEVEVSRL